MHNLTIQCTHPWLLLLLIPAFAITLFLYFRLSKKYRRTRNRITSIVLHLIVMVLCISVLSGMSFSYNVSNDKNEIILLVDVSETSEQAQEIRDDFIQTVLNYGQYDNFKIGVVTFGFDQRYAVPLTNDIESIYDKYIKAELPDISATNIAAALNYTKDLFNYPETAKIVLISDGKETDEEAATAIRYITAQGILVDTAFIPSEYKEDDVQIVNVTLPDYHISVGEKCTINVTIQSKSAKGITIELFDNEILRDNKAVNIVAGTQTIEFDHTFQDIGFHEIVVKIHLMEDLLEQNNQYVSYLYLQQFDKILIIERMEGESDNLLSILTEKGDDDDRKVYNVEVVNIYKSDNIPASVDELRAYDQIILNNISNADLRENINVPVGFDEMLFSYVHKYGGGVFTVGGDDENGEANTYKREDMYGSVYQEMLPVQAIKYTPPLGVIVIVDSSGSMGSTDLTGATYLDCAKAGASACLRALSERDYFGFMTLDSDYEMVLPLTPRTREAEIYAAIQSVEKADGGTVFPGAIERAGQALRALPYVDRRHIILVTDGGVPENQRIQYEELINDYYIRNKISLSVVAIGVTKDSDYDETTPIELLDKENLTTYERMLRAVILGHGRIYATSDTANLTYLMREDLNVPELKLVNYEPFLPTINNALSPVIIGIERGEGTNKNKMTVELEGFYGIKIRQNADLILTGDYDVPIYAQWKFGLGMVGSFMCDLNGKWSSGFIQNENGQRLILNVINNLMPTQDIRPKDISASLNEDNYTNQLSVYTNLNNGEYVQGYLVELSSVEQNQIPLNEITDITKDEGATYYVTLPLGETNNYSRCNLVIKESGTYKIVLTKYDSDDTAISTYEMFKTFSYSEEYNTLVEETEMDLRNKLINIAQKGNGAEIMDLEDPKEIFDPFKTSVGKTYDPRFLFIILSIIAFLLDIAVRKFKFKWPHELIREYKKRKLDQQK